MDKINKRDAQLFGGNLIAASVIAIFTKQFHLLGFINILFCIFMGYIVVFLFLFIKKGRFFDGLVFGFRRFNWIMFRKRRGITEEDWMEKPLPSEKSYPALYNNTMRQSILLFLLLMILLMFYYYI